MAALVEPSDSAHHAAGAEREDAGVNSATQDLSRRFEEMDFDHDGARRQCLLHARLCTLCSSACAPRYWNGMACPGLGSRFMHVDLNQTSAPLS